MKSFFFLISIMAFYTVAAQDTGWNEADLKGKVKTVTVYKVNLRTQERKKIYTSLFNVQGIKTGEQIHAWPSSEIIYEYDSSGRKRRSVKINSKGKRKTDTEWIYDSADRLIREVQPYMTFIYKYDEVGRRKSTEVRKTKKGHLIEYSETNYKEDSSFHTTWIGDQVSNYRIIISDSLAREVQNISMSKPGSRYVNTYVTVYDGSGRVKEKINYDKDGILNRAIMEYNQFGDLNRSISTGKQFSGQTFIYTVEYVYDLKGNILKETYRDDGKITSIKEYEYEYYD